MASPKRVYVHLGLHKTGTTSIQVALGHARSQLAKHGFLYPTIGCPEWAPFGQHLLPWSLFQRDHYLPIVHNRRARFDDPQRHSLWEKLKAEIEASGAENVVISSEEFDVFSAGEIDALGHHLHEYTIVPVIFLRNFSDLVESSYRTSIVYSQFEGDISSFSANMRTRLDYHVMLHDWRRIAADGVVRILSYDDPCISTNSLETLLTTVGLNSTIDANAAKRVNESTPAFICEIVRFFRSKNVGEPSVDAFIKQFRPVLFKANSVKKYTCLPPALEAELDARYRDEVARLTSDPTLTVTGRLGRDAAEEKSEPINNIVTALLAVAREIEVPARG